MTTPTPTPTPTLTDTSHIKFDDMNLKENLLRGIYAYGFEEPSVIQQRAIIPLTHGGDLIGQAQSGTGKTATFSISCLQNIDETINQTQAIVLAHTRELASQICKVMQQLASKMDVSIHGCIGKNYASGLD